MKYVHIVCITDPVNKHPFIIGVFESQALAHDEAAKYSPKAWVITAEVR